MSAHKLVRPLVASFVLAFTGAAFARQPPALVQRQMAADQAAACGDARVDPGAGYRDSLIRLHASKDSPSMPSMSSQSHGGIGYRDLVSRFGATTTSRVACHKHNAPASL